MQATIEKIIYPGRSLARCKGKTIITDEGIPGERVEVVSLTQKERYLQAATTQVYRASPYRTNPRCSHYKACSPYQYIEYPFQIETKRKQVEEILSRGLNINCPEITVKASRDIFLSYQT